jgi:hypothetical protein
MVQILSGRDLVMVPNGESRPSHRCSAQRRKSCPCHRLMLTPQHQVDVIHRRERTGRPLGKAGFIEKLEIAFDQILRPQTLALKKMSRVRDMQRERKKLPLCE